MAGKARVVVVGGGVAGALLAKTMQDHADVVLLDPKEYLEIPWAELRSMPLSSSWLHDTILKESLDSKGRVMVEKDLRVKGYNNVFAIGDITDIPEIKQGYLAQKHALLVAKNMKLLIKGTQLNTSGL
nr:unnamed protein product [Digitaria exilis]